MTAPLPAPASRMYIGCVGLSHVCLGCGLDLAFERAVVEPWYRLPIVACPGCGAVVVRRRHPIQAAWRRGRRVVRAIGAAGTRLAIAALLAGFTALGVWAFCSEGAGKAAAGETSAWALLRREALEGDLREWLAREGMLIVSAWLAFQVGAGAWLAGFDHWRRGVTLAAWAAGLALLLSIDVAWHPLDRAWLRATGGTPVAAPDWLEWRLRMMLVVVSVAAAAPGLWLGSGLRALWRRTAAARFGRRRRRRRERRHGRT